MQYLYKFSWRFEPGFYLNIRLCGPFFPDPIGNLLGAWFRTAAASSVCRSAPWRISNYGSYVLVTYQRLVLEQTQVLLLDFSKFLPCIMSLSQHFVLDTKKENIDQSLRNATFCLCCSQVKTLCRQWFPIEYPDVWYEDITTNPHFYALAATLHMQIIGLLVAETKPLSKMNKEVKIFPYLLIYCISS